MSEGGWRAGASGVSTARKPPPLPESDAPSSPASDRCSSFRPSSFRHGRSSTTRLSTPPSLGTALGRFTVQDLAALRSASLRPACVRHRPFTARLGSLTKTCFLSSRKSPTCRPLALASLRTTAWTRPSASTRTGSVRLSRSDSTVMRFKTDDRSSWTDGTDNAWYARRWEQVLGAKRLPAFVQVLSWNDFGEAHCQAALPPTLAPLFKGDFSDLILLPYVARGRHRSR